MRIAKSSDAAALPPALKVRTASNANAAQEFRFAAPFRIGRVADCEVCIVDEHVSRAHVQVEFQEGQWWVRDLNSSNGIFVDGQRVTSVAIAKPTTVKLGIFGPQVSFEVEKLDTRQAPPAGATTVASYVDRYFTDKPVEGGFGEHTIMVRRAFAEVRTKQRGRYNLVIAALVLLALGGAGVAFYEHRKAAHQREMAESIFYAMKSLDLDIANLQKAVFASGTPENQRAAGAFVSRRQQMEADYDQFLNTLHTYDQAITPRRRLILRMARIFGECELTMPPDFANEIEAYIAKWKSTGRLSAGVRTANQNGYTRKIAEALLAQGLPPQFFYLALQESGFDPYISGPITYKGYAKGMWQFIPETALKYGLHLGPLVEFPRPDPGDDRHHWDLETVAATKYIKDLYSSDAQASGLLVAACYNWGEGRVLPLVRSMPLNPRERNFWRFIALYRDKIPPETYNYVFYIASAAVIGEDPRLFGFDFDNPLSAKPNSPNGL